MAAKSVLPRRQFTLGQLATLFVLIAVVLRFHNGPHLTLALQVLVLSRIAFLAWRAKYIPTISTTLVCCGILAALETAALSDTLDGIFLDHWRLPGIFDALFDHRPDAFWLACGLGFANTVVALGIPNERSTLQTFTLFLKYLGLICALQAGLLTVAILRVMWSPQLSSDMIPSSSGSAISLGVPIAIFTWSSLLAIWLVQRRHRNKPLQ